MKNIILILLLIIVIIFIVRSEPISDTFDAIGGSTNQTYSVTIDGTASASYEHEEDDD